MLSIDHFPILGKAIVNSDLDPLALKLSQGRTLGDDELKEYVAEMKAIPAKIQQVLDLSLFNGYTLGQIPRLIYVTTAHDRDVIGQ